MLEVAQMFISKRMAKHLCSYNEITNNENKLLKHSTT